MSKSASSTTSARVSASEAPQVQGRLPLRAWALELARRWNGGTYSVFVVHGNIFDVFPVQNAGGIAYVPLEKFLMQRRFFEWLEIYDNVENTNFHQQGPPREFTRLAPLLRRFFLKVSEDRKEW